MSSHETHQNYQKENSESGLIVDTSGRFLDGKRRGIQGELHRFNLTLEKVPNLLDAITEENI